MALARRSETHVPPYAADGKTAYVDPGQQDPAYAVEPDGNTDYYADPYLGWAPKTALRLEGTPDPTRLEETVRVDRRANLRNPWAWWRNLDKDTATRESVTDTDADGWTQLKQGSKSIAPRPGNPGESRPTQAMSPRTYLFSRPFDQDVARRFTGEHMSLAVNRRNYEILTMAPVTPRRNTYRVDPVPWDTDIVDQTPPPNEGLPSARLQVPNLPPSMTSRSYRL
jgi:hypothetical protein